MVFSFSCHPISNIQSIVFKLVINKRNTKVTAVARVYLSPLWQNPFAYWIIRFYIWYFASCLEQPIGRPYGNSDRFCCHKISKSGFWANIYKINGWFYSWIFWKRQKKFISWFLETKLFWIWHRLFKVIDFSYVNNISINLSNKDMWNKMIWSSKIWSLILKYSWNLHYVFGEKGKLFILMHFLIKCNLSRSQMK